MRRPEVLRILHVEDDLADAILVKKAFEKSGVPTEVTHVTGGVKALELMEAGHVYDLVLLDLNMPGMSGHDLLAEIREGGMHPDVPVLVLTTSTSPTDVRRAYRGHANVYHVKPGEFSEFVALGKAIGEHWSKFAVVPEAGV